MGPSLLLALPGPRHRGRGGRLIRLEGVGGSLLRGEGPCPVLRDSGPVDDAS